MANLSAKEKSLISDAWKQVAKKDTAETGMIMYTRLFSERPDLMAVFPYLGGQSLDQLKTNDKLVKNSVEVLKLLSSSVALLDAGDMNSMAANIHAVGPTHIKHGLKAEYFTPMEDALFHAMGQQMGAGKFTADMRAAWSKLFQFIVGMMSQDLKA